MRIVYCLWSYKISTCGLKPRRYPLRHMVSPRDIDGATELAQWNEEATRLCRGKEAHGLSVARDCQMSYTNHCPCPQRAESALFTLFRCGRPQRNTTECVSKYNNARQSPLAQMVRSLVCKASLSMSTMRSWRSVDEALGGPTS